MTGFYVPSFKSGKNQQPGSPEMGGNLVPCGLPAVWQIGMAVSTAVCLVFLAHHLSSLLGISVPLACKTHLLLS